MKAELVEKSAFGGHARRVRAGGLRTVACPLVLLAVAVPRRWCGGPPATPAPCLRCAALQLQEAYQAKLEDEQVLFQIRSQLSQMAASRDQALERELFAKELISELQDDVQRLRSQVSELQTTVAQLEEVDTATTIRPPLMAGSCAPLPLPACLRVCVCMRVHGGAH